MANLKLLGLAGSFWLARGLGKVRGCYFLNLFPLFFRTFANHKKAGTIECIVRFLQVDMHQTTERRMSKLDAETRGKLSDKTFGEPSKRAYPMPDKSRAANSKARASQAVKAGRMSKAEEHKIDAKADKVIKKHR